MEWGLAYSDSVAKTALYTPIALTLLTGTVVYGPVNRSVFEVSDFRESLCRSSTPHLTREEWLETLRAAETGAEETP